jgi:transposase
MDPTLLYPIEHRSEEMQRDLLQIKLRDNLVRQRVDVISSVRFTLKSLGIALRSPNTACFAKHARKELGGKESEATLALIEPSLKVIDSMTQQIRTLEVAITELATSRYVETELMMLITGLRMERSAASWTERSEARRVRPRGNERSSQP